MKNLILMLVIYSLSLYSQGWNNTVQTGITGVLKQESFANKDGIHVLTETTQGITYSLMNTGGSVIRSSVIESGGTFPNITGNSNEVYAIFKSGDYLIIKKSTNAGVNWDNCPSIPTSGNMCNGVDAVFQEDQGVHIVWATKDSDPYYETYYCLLNINNQLTGFTNVTDYTVDEVGGYPTVTYSANKVHVSFNTGYMAISDPNYGEAKLREKLLSTDQWLTTETVLGGRSNLSCWEKVYQSNGQLFYFYFKRVSGMGQLGFLLMAKSRNVSGTTWTEYDPIYPNWLDVRNFVDITSTTDNNIHVVYSSGFDLYYRKYNGTEWEANVILSTDDPNGIPPSVAAVTNDLYITWQGSNSSYLSLKQYDTNPSAPEGVSLTNSSGHPNIQWLKSKDPDVSSYKVYRKIGNDPWNYLAMTSSLYYYDQTVAITPNGGLEGTETYYKVLAKDISNYESDFSNSVSCFMERIELDKKGDHSENEITDFSLAQNFPNPFNPSTVIEFSIPAKGFVELKVYNILGKEVATLVNEIKEAGSYKVTFNGNELTTGIYLYKLITDKRSEFRKMIYLK